MHFIQVTIQSTLLAYIATRKNILKYIIYTFYNLLMLTIYAQWTLRIKTMHSQGQIGFNLDYSESISLALVCYFWLSLISGLTSGLCFISLRSLYW